MSPIATLLNEAFILNKYEEKEQYILVNDYKVEKNILREAVSPRSLQQKRKELLIFPYSYNEQNQLLRYSEDEFFQQFPETSKYLQLFIEKLNMSDKDESAKWFEFGRSQALHQLNQENCYYLL